MYQKDDSSSNSSGIEQRQTYQTVLAAIFLIITMIVALVGNIAVITVICLYRNLRRDRSNILIINLSITDLTNTVLIMFSALISILIDYWPFSVFWCDCICAINYCLIIVSMLTLCCISIDRYQAVMHPLTYISRVTRPRLYVVIAYTWIQGVAFGMVPSMLNWVQYDYWEAICAIQWHLYHPDSIIYVVTAFIVCFLGPGIILIHCYMKILKEVKRQQMRTLDMPGNTGDTNMAQKSVSDRSRLVRSLLVVVFAYFICTAPFSVTKLIKVSVEDANFIPGPINLVASLLGYVASAINPLIYGIFRHDFRKAYKKLLKQLCTQQWKSDTFTSSDSNARRSNAYRSEFDNVTINNTATSKIDLKDLHTTPKPNKTTGNDGTEIKHAKQTVCQAQMIATLYDSPKINNKDRVQDFDEENVTKINRIHCVQISVKALAEKVNGDIEEFTLSTQ